MANWKYKIELKPVLERMGEKYDLECVEKRCPAPVKKAIAAELEKAMPLKRFAPRIIAAKSIAEVNRILANVYDEADRSLVWCGM